MGRTGRQSKEIFSYLCAVIGSEKKTLGKKISAKHRGTVVRERKKAF